MTISKGLAEGQVLQRLGSRGATVEISGQSAETGPVLATISGAKGVLKGWKGRRVGTSARGNFSATLTGIPAGGPYRLEVRVGKEKAAIREFFVGDVWVMAGQSNMEGVGNMSAPAKPHPLIRCFSMRREWRLATDPLHLLAESPDPCHSEAGQVTPERGEEMRRTAKKGVGAGIFFAREMMKRSGVPQGLIATAHGGTSMSQWDPKTGEMYASMLVSVRATQQPVAGLIWYQGESDTTEKQAAVYTQAMKSLVAATRRDLRLPNLPWAIVQLSRVYDPRTDPYWNNIQEQQRLLPDKIKNFETVAAIDLPLDDGIHISAEAYAVLGSRLAVAMNRFTGGDKKRPPQLAKIAISQTATNPVIDVTFGSVEKGLVSAGLPQGFCLINAEGKPIPAIFKTTLHGNVARLHVGTIDPGLSLHYGFGVYPICNIIDGRNLSLPVFGPVPVSKPTALLPFVKLWKTSGLLPSSQPLAKIACPDLGANGGTAKAYTDGHEGLINEHESWKGKPGQHYFSSALDLSEPMKLRFLMGYDGPFRLWLDGQLFYQDLQGTNPAIPDQGNKNVALAAGRHQITVAMDTNNGAAWGFFLRFVRLDVTSAQLQKKSYTAPAYSI